MERCDENKISTHSFEMYAALRWKTVWLRAIIKLILLAKWALKKYDGSYIECQLLSIQMEISGM